MVTAMNPGLLTLWAAAAAALEIFPSHGHVRSIRFEPEGALIETAGGAFRVPGLRPLPNATEWGGCRYETTEAGVRRRCGEQDQLIPVGGFPTSGVAAYRGELFVGTYGGGLRRLYGGRVGGVPDSVTALAAIRGGLLCGTEKGLYRVGPGGVGRIDPPSLPIHNVSALASGAGALWVGSFDGGLAALSSGGWRHWTKADGLPSDWIDGLAFDGEKLWGATEKGVFWIVDGRAVRPENPALHRPTAALHAGGGAVYLAQPGRVIVIRPQGTETLEIPEKHPQRIWSAGEEIWVAGLRGLYRVRGGLVTRFSTAKGELPADWVTALEPWEGGLLVGTYDGGLIHRPAAGEPRPVLEKTWVNLGALAASNGRVAVGEMDGGLWLQDGGAWRRLKREDGLPSNDVTAVLFDQDALWIGTREGLARLMLSERDAKGATTGEDTDRLALRPSDPGPVDR
ncbi:MAG: hypothetical protein HY553_14280 [Elusimicrobia bacterium]|nr:hypothetical protein [Elusimicrobiota bacterium]